MTIYYVVLQGHKTGICMNLGELAFAVSNHPNPEYKQFDKFEEAQEYYSDSLAKQKKSLPAIEPKHFNKERTLRIGEPIEGSICVSISSSTVEQGTLYRAMDVYSETLIFESKSHFKLGSIHTFIGIVDALQFLDQKGLRVPVYSTSTHLVDLINFQEFNRLFGQIQKWHSGFASFYIRYKWLLNKSKEKPHVLEDVLLWHTDAWGDIPSKYKCSN